MPQPNRLAHRVGPRARLLRLALAVCVLVGAPLTSGCASTSYLAVRRVPANPLDWRLRLVSRSGPEPTPRTKEVLRRYGLLDEHDQDKSKMLERLQLELAAEPTPDKAYSFAELAYVEGRAAENDKDLSRALDHYGAAVAHAYLYLFDPRFDRFRNPYDPQFRGASNLYNTALEAALRIVNQQGKLKPGATQVVHTATKDFHVKVVVRGPWHDEDFERFEFVSDYRLTGLRTQNRTYGLGVPLIAVRRQHEAADAKEKYYPPGLSFAVTAFLRVLPENSTTAGEQPCHCVLELHDPLDSPNIVAADRLVPLETDLSTPLAFFLDNPAFAERRDAATLGLLDPGKTRELTGLFMLEPFDPQRIPVLMVHGLWSSPVTWMEMFNDLRSFPEIRENYQFWFYLYPTGQPFWISATQMRRDLAEVRQTLDPQRSITTLDQMVLVGHSMGGLVSNMQVLSSEDKFWNILSDQPFEKLEADPETKQRLAQVLFFEPNPSIRRVVTIGTPHRGSEFANDYTRWLGRKLIALPASLLQTGQKLARNNPGLFHDTQLLQTTTSIDSLAPDAPILPVIREATKPPWVKFHNIVGVVADSGFVGRISGGGDGVVSYESAHLEDVESELVVEADHVTIHQNTRAILEVRRILRDHLMQLVAERSQYDLAPSGPRVPPAARELLSPTVPPPARSPAPLVEGSSVPVRSLVPPAPHPPTVPDTVPPAVGPTAPMQSPRSPLKSPEQPVPEPLPPVPPSRWSQSLDTPNFGPASHFGPAVPAWPEASERTRGVQPAGFLPQGKPALGP